MKSKNGSGFHDPAFASNKSLPIHRWVPWIAGFGSGFVRDAISRYLPETGCILDPFAGVGTTLVEGLLAGHNVIGFEINPYASLACKVKLNAHNVRLETLQSEIEKLKDFYEETASDGYNPKSTAPAGFKTRADFYSPRVLRKVLIIRDFIDGIKSRLVRDLFRLAFASTMVTYSNYSYEPSLGRRVSAGKAEIHDYHVAESVINKPGEMFDDIYWLKENLPNGAAEAQVIEDTFMHCRNHVKSGVADLVVTSPPYLNNYHYNRNTRPQLYWLGLAQQPHDLEYIENLNFGKFWQTVRGLERLDLEFKLPSSDMAERLEQLRATNREKGVYGGNGWANYAAAYFNDCYKFSQQLKYVLRRGRTALVVIGNSILQGVFIPTDEYFAKIAEAVGLECVGIEIPRSTRVGNSIIQSDVRVAKAEDRQKLYEAVVILRRP